MPSTNPNIFKRAYENVMGTPEQNKKAKEENEKYKASKAKEKEKEEAEKKMNKGGYAKKIVKPKKMAAGGKVTKAGSKAAKASKAPLLTVMIGIPKAKKK